MSAATTHDWQHANQHYLVAALAEVRCALQRHIGDQAAAELAEPAPRAASLPPPALQTLCDLFRLSPFERALLLLCAGMELDASFAGLCAAAQGDPARPYPTLSLALAALPDPHWSALTPAAPLRRWRMIEVGTGSSLTLSPLRIDERVLHYLAGVSYLDERLSGYVEPVRSTAYLTPAQQVVADRIVAIWSQQAGAAGVPVIQLCGPDTAATQALAAVACVALDLNLHVLPADLVPANPADLETLMRLWEREAALSTSALLVDCHTLDASDAVRTSAVTRLIEQTNSALLVSSRERRAIQHRPQLTIDVPQPSRAEQRAAWHQALGPAGATLNGHVDALVTQFNLSTAAFYAASAEARNQGSSEAELLTDPQLLWDACRVQARPHLDDLAQRIEPVATWNDLVLPEAQRRTLQEIVIHVKQRATVYETWGFSAKGGRGLGISALFAGVSGTGKTLAAEVLAHELRLDLYKIDLSQVVSKYIGETEKNLRRVFDAAEKGGAVLLFDEADALFGKRSEVKDSHDRYANIEVSYLLQRMEAYRGLAILTTNLKNAIDPAFMRRIRFIVQFPFPDATQRAEIWRRIFPASTPTERLDVSKLARLNIAGGNIRNIALNAAFRAADAGEPVRMSHLEQAARAEYAKLEKALTDVEIGGW